MNNFYKGYHKRLKEVEMNMLTKVGKITSKVNEQAETRLVEHLLSRIKTKESVQEKLIIEGQEATIENAIDTLSDLIGLRIIVHFVSDIYTIRNLLVNSRKFKIIKEKDYVIQAKNSGYRGYHLIVEERMGDRPIKVEIQIRTIAMDCWASLEHQIRYKKDVMPSDTINARLQKCSEELLKADLEMEEIWACVKNKAEHPKNMYSDLMECISNTQSCNTKILI